MFSRIMRLILRVLKGLIRHTSLDLDLSTRILPLASISCAMLSSHLSFAVSRLFPGAIVVSDMEAPSRRMIGLLRSIDTLRFLFEFKF
jgi:hypothetical protein